MDQSTQVMYVRTKGGKAYTGGQQNKQKNDKNKKKTQTSLRTCLTEKQ